MTGGTVTGSGTVVGTIENGGGILTPGSSPGTLTVPGNLTQTSGSLPIETGGTQSSQVPEPTAWLLLLLGLAVLVVSSDHARTTSDSLRH